MALQIYGVGGGGLRAAPSRIRTELSRDDVWAALAQSGDDEKAITISELAQRSEAELAECIDVIVAVLAEQPPVAVRIAVCQAIRAAGAAGFMYASEVLQLLHEHNAQVKYEACLALAGMGEAASLALNTVRGLLGDASEIVRYGACAALGGFGASSCMADVAALLSDPSMEVQGAACWALGKMSSSGGPSAEAVAARLKEPACRLQALRALALMGPKSVGPYCEQVCECLADDDDDIRMAAVAAVGRLAEPVSSNMNAASKVSGLLLSQDGRQRIAAATAIGAMGRFAADQADALVEMLRDDFSEPPTTALTVGGVRPRLPVTWRKASCAAALALGRIAVYSGDARKVAEEVGRLLHSNDWEQRAVACEALGHIGASARSQASSIAHLFEDTRHVVRANAASAYGKLGETGNLEALLALLEDKAPSVREAATGALARLDEHASEHIERIAARLCDTAPNVRAVAADALATVAHDRGRYYAGALAQRLVADGEAVVVKAAALRALGGMGERGAVYADLISSFAHGQTPELRDAAERSLRTLGIKADLLQIGGEGNGDEGGGGIEGGAQE